MGDRWEFTVVVISLHVLHVSRSQNTTGHSRYATSSLRDFSLRCFFTLSRAGLRLRVIVETGCRLHAGFYYAGLDWGIRWGGAGFYAVEPRVVVEAYPCGRLELSGFRGRESLVLEALVKLGVRGVCLNAHSLIPAHVGLGSTTQLLLASSISALTVLGSRVDPLDLAVTLGRGRVSWVGSLLFKLGGFIVDSGAPAGKPRPMARLDIPDDWVFVIVTPSIERGLSEVEEEPLLREPWEPSLEASYHMSRGVLRLASGIARGDIVDALKGLRELQLGTGMYFSRLQGGVYRGILGEIVEKAESKGVILAQSSWGPTLYTITRSQDSGYVVDVLTSTLRSRGLEGLVWVSRPRNSGASIIVES